MAANLDFCRHCEAPYTSREGDMGMCPTCEIRSEAIAEQLREAEDLRDELDRLDVEQKQLRDELCWDEDKGKFDCDGNPPYMDNHYSIK